MFDLKRFLEDKANQAGKAIGNVGNAISRASDNYNPLDRQFQQKAAPFVRPVVNQVQREVQQRVVQPTTNFVNRQVIQPFKDIQKINSDPTLARQVMGAPQATPQQAIQEKSFMDNSNKLRQQNTDVQKKMGNTLLDFTVRPAARAGMAIGSEISKYNGGGPVDFNQNDIKNPILRNVSKLALGSQDTAGILGGYSDSVGGIYGKNAGSYESQGKDFAKVLGANDNTAATIGLVAAPVMVILDMPFAGGGKYDDAVKIIAKAGTAKQVVNALGKIGKSVDISTVNKLVKETDPNAVKKIMQGAQTPSVSPLAKVDVPVKGGVDKGGVIQDAINPSKVSEVVPQLGKPKTTEYGFLGSAKKSDLVSPQAKANLTGGDEVRLNSDLLDKAAIRISNDPVKAHDFAIKTKSDEGTATAIALAQKYRKEGNFELEASLINEKAARLREAGREVQAASLIDKMSPEGIVSSAAQTIQRYNETAKKPISELTGAMAKEFSDIADSIAKMPEGRERNIAIYQLRQKAANLIPSTVLDKAVTVWKAGLLTSPRTTMRNLIGNAVHGAAEIAKDPFATVNDMALSLKTGKREVTTTLRGELSGGKKGMQAGKDIALLGFDPEHSIEKFDINHVTWADTPIQQGLKKYTDIVFRNMGMQDKPYYHAAFGRSLYDQAGAEAINAGKRGDTNFIENLVKNPNERMLTNATKDAQIAVFQNPNIGSKTASKIKQALNDKSNGLGAIANIVMPFTGVPSSIAGQMISYSPIGLIKGIAKDFKVLSGKIKPEMLPDLQRQASQEVGRGVIGTGIIGLGVYLTNKGLMTGQPKDAKESQQWELEGKQANSLMVNGKWRSINSIGPEALVLLAGSKIAEGKDASTTAAAIGKDFTSQTFLSGVQQPLNAISDPARYGGTYIPSQVSSMIPNIIKDTAKAFDPLQRQTFVSKNLPQSTVNSVKIGIPGLSNTLLPKLDALGNPLKQEPTGVGAFVDLFNSKTPIKNPVVNELSRLNMVDQNAAPTDIKNDTLKAVGIAKLTPQQLDDLSQKSGNALRPALDQLVNSDAYKSASDEEKKNAIGTVVSNTRDSVKLGYANGSGAVDTKTLTSKATMTLNKDAFEKSGKPYEVKDGMVYTRNPDNTAATPVTEAKFSYDIGKEYLQKYKTEDDLANWMDTAQGQYDNIKEQLKDKNLSPKDQITLQNDAQTLLNDMAKYKDYGGFTKGGSGGSQSASIAKTISLLKSDTTSQTTADTYKYLQSLLGSTRKSSKRKVNLKKVS